MAVDKLVDSSQLDADLTSVADAIRTKGGTSVSLAFPADFLTAIAAIPTGGGDPIMRQVKNLGENALKNATLPEVCHFPELTTIGTHCMQFATGQKIVVLPMISNIGTSAFTGTTTQVQTLEVIDFGTSTPNFGTWLFSGATALNTIIIRKPSVVTVANINAFNATPFATNGAATGGTLYVPAALIANYQAATNWSTILGYAKNNIRSIEGSSYETQYADGTPIA